MSKSAKKRAPKAAAARGVASQSSQPAKTTSTTGRKKADKKGSKQSRVIEMLRLSTGTTIAAVMEVTGWQPHSVRGFFTGVVQKKLRLKLNSEKINGNRVYRIVEPGSARSKTEPVSSRTA